VRVIGGLAFQDDDAPSPPVAAAAHQPPTPPCFRFSGGVPVGSPAKLGSLESSDDSNSSSLAPLPSQARLFSAENSLATASPQQQQQQHQYQHLHERQRLADTTAEPATSVSHLSFSRVQPAKHDRQLQQQQQQKQCQRAALLVFAQETQQNSQVSPEPHQGQIVTSLQIIVA
jgi:hypothetical protein